MTNENLIHIKLEYIEALQSKKDILMSEMQVLKVLKSIKRYRAIRSEELALKEKLYRTVKSFIASTKTLELSLPKPKIPEILRKGNHEEEQSILERKIPEDENLESQLREIQARLAEISQ